MIDIVERVDGSRSSDATVATVIAPRSTKRMSVRPLKEVSRPHSVAFIVVTWLSCFHRREKGLVRVATKHRRPFRGVGGCFVSERFGQSGEELHDA